jgi:hypothetical protein
MEGGHLLLVNGGFGSEREGLKQAGTAEEERPNGPREKLSGVPFARQKGKNGACGFFFQGQGGAAVEKIDFRFFLPPRSP